MCELEDTSAVPSTHDGDEAHLCPLDVLSILKSIDEAHLCPLDSQVNSTAGSVLFFGADGGASYLIHVDVRHSDDA